MKLDLTESEANAVQYMVWYFANKFAPGYKDGLKTDEFASTEEVRKLWEKIMLQIRKTK